MEHRAEFFFSGVSKKLVHEDVNFESPVFQLKTEMTN